MSNYSYINLIKRQAKAHSATSSIKLWEAQEQVALNSGFSDFVGTHNLTANKCLPFLNRTLSLKTAVLQPTSRLHQSSLRPQSSTLARCHAARALEPQRLRVQRLT